MAEKKATKVAAPKKEKEAAKKTATRVTTAKKKAEVVINAESVGFRAGDVYQTLAAAGKALSISEISKLAKISAEETYLGIGWLFKEGKVRGEDTLITLA